MRATSQTSYTGKHSKDSKSHLIRSILTLDLSLVLLGTIGYVDLMTTFGQSQLSRRFIVRYLMVNTNTLYFAMIGRKTLNELRAFVSTTHLKMKFPTLIGEIMTVKVDQK